MNKTEQLAQILDRLNQDPTDRQTQQDAKALIANVSALELSLAEQKLIEQGLEPSKLQHLCAAHLEVLEPEMALFRHSLGIGHPMDTMIKEHDEILGLLAELEQLNRRLQALSAYDAENPDFTALAAVAEGLLGAENHHLREEQGLFPLLEERGITGPPRIMRMEHEQLRKRKQALLDLATAVQDGLAYDRFLDSLAEAAGYLVFNLRDHIFKENNILYPTAKDTLTDETIWQELKQKCDQIGYCPFTKAEWR